MPEPPPETPTLAAAPSPALLQAPLLAPAQISGVFFLDAQTGWVIGRSCPTAEGCGPAAAQTFDGGRTWQALPAPPAAGEPVFVNALFGWLHAEGSVFVTPDGGQTWAPVARPGWVEALAPAAGETWSVERACAEGAPEPRECPLALAASADGGQTWAIRGVVPGSERGAFVRLARADAVTAWLTFGAPGIGPVVYLSRDAGLSWEGPVPVCPAEYPNLRWLGAADAQVAWAVCGGAPAPYESDYAKAVLRSVDGGQNWTLQIEVTDPLAPAGLLKLAEVNDLQALSAERAVITQCPGRIPGSSAPSGMVILTQDGGLTWAGAEPAEAFSGLQCYSDARFNGPALGWAWSVEGIALSLDGGFTWSAAAWPANFVSIPYPPPDWPPDLSTYPTQ